MPRYNYTCFGLRIGSDFPCPELLPSEGPPNVRLRLGPVDATLPGSTRGGVLYDAAPGRFLLRIPGISRYLVTGGTEIVVDTAGTCDHAAMRLFLLGTAFGALLHQRGLLPLHASAIAGPRGAVLFAGPSGSGKSTLAALFAQRGYSVLTDEVCAVDASVAPVVFPAGTQVCLWADALDALKIECRELRPVRAGLEKYALPVTGGAVPGPLPLHSVYVIRSAPAGKPSLERLRGLDKIRALAANTYRENFVPHLGVSGGHFRQVQSVAHQTRIVLAQRPESFSQLESLADLLAEDFTS